MAQDKTVDQGQASKPKPRVKLKQNPPAAGPHAKPELTDKDKTPGSGVLPEVDDKQTEAPTG